jgi:hypothetical protein
VEVERVTAREFIRIWQTSNSVAEVAKKTGCTKKTVRVRAWRFRTLFDIPLKVFPMTAFDYPDWDELAEFAESLVREPTGEAAAEDGTSSGAIPTRPTPCHLEALPWETPRQLRPGIAPCSRRVTPILDRDARVG